MTEAKKRLPRIYIAGPFAGKTAWEIERNVRRAEEAAYRVARYGGFPITPHTMSRFFFGEIGEDFWKQGYRELLEACDAIYMCSGWRWSEGSQAELARAKELGLSVLYEGSPADIAKFLAGWFAEGEAA